MRGKPRTVAERRIVEMADALGKFAWVLRHGCVRTMLSATDGDNGIVRCPIAMLVHEVTAERRAAVLKQPRFRAYAERVRTVAEENHEAAWCSHPIEARSLREHLEQSRGRKLSTGEAQRAAAALVAHAQPTHPALAEMTGMSTQTINRIARASDYPKHNRFGAELIAAFGLTEASGAAG